MAELPLNRPEGIVRYLRGLLKRYSVQRYFLQRLHQEWTVTGQGQMLTSSTAPSINISWGAANPRGLCDATDHQNSRITHAELCTPSDDSRSLVSAFPVTSYLVLLSPLVSHTRCTLAPRKRSWLSCQAKAWLCLAMAYTKIILWIIPLSDSPKKGYRILFKKIVCPQHRGQKMNAGSERCC